MKIGILTFHWATNYGAVLQCYALQTYLENLGHTVEVIDYKPRQYDDTLYSFFRFRKFVHLINYVKNKKKESALVVFRNQKLRMSMRYYSYKEMVGKMDMYDVIVSGSDQVVNPYFFMSGEGRRKITPTYFIGFPFKGKRIGYALSFGCVDYPEEACSIAVDYIKKFNVITVRENTGINIIKSMGRDDAIVVPDPTLLMDSSFYQSIAIEHSIDMKSYVYCFFIRNITERKPLINGIFNNRDILWNNDDESYSIQSWLSKILHANFVVTDSFHCVVMCLKLHKPFAVVTEYKGIKGMNDRHYTLLSRLSLTNRIIYKEQVTDIINLYEETIDWTQVDTLISRTNIVVDDIFNNICL